MLACGGAKSCWAHCQYASQYRRQVTVHSILWIRVILNETLVDLIEYFPAASRDALENDVYILLSVSKKSRNQSENSILGNEDLLDVCVGQGKRPQFELQSSIEQR